MQKVIDKTKSYIGFAIKSNSILFGSDNIEKKHKKNMLIILCSSVNEKVKNNMLKIGAPTVVLKNNVLLSQLVERANVKVIALTNENLSNAVLNYSELFEKLN